MSPRLTAPEPRKFWVALVAMARSATPEGVAAPTAEFQRTLSQARRVKFPGGQLAHLQAATALIELGIGFASAMTAETRSLLAPPLAAIGEALDRVLTAQATEMAQRSYWMGRD
jgi:hypothetical protein